MLVALAAFASAGPAGHAEAQGGFRAIGSQPVQPGQTRLTIEAALGFFPTAIRLTSGACDTSPDQAVVLEGTLTRSSVDLASGSLTPVGAAAEALAADSAINADVVEELLVSNADVQLPNGLPLRFAVVGITVHLSRDNGFPNIPAFTICAA
jgi:hypothetical protein